MRSLTFPINEMQCPSCRILAEIEPQEHPHIRSIDVHLDTKTVDVVGDFDGMSTEEIGRELTPIIAERGYTISLSEAGHPLSAIIRALPFAAAIIGLFLVLQTLGLEKVFTGDTHLAATALLVGFVASLSSCGAVAGGLALSLSAHYAARGERIVPQVIFHLGRLIAFFLLGGALGAAGTIFTLGFYGSLILNGVVALMMLILGISLLKLAHIRTLTLPASISRPIKVLTTTRHPIAPFLLGALTFFLPCGFTQSAQVYVLGLGGFAAGAHFMGLFAAGSLPILLLISGMPLAFRSPEKKELMNTTAGILVVFFAIYMLYGSLHILV